MSASKDDKQKLYVAIGAVAAVAVVGGAAYYFWSKKQKSADGEAEHRSHSAHHERQAKSGQKDQKSSKARVDSALASIDFARATKISKDQIATIWEKYDADRNGSLDASEIKALVKEVLGQISQEKSSLTKYMTAMFDENTAADHKHEIQGRLKNLHAELHASADGVAKQLMNRLDANRDGKISKEEFVQAFAQWLEQYHTNEIRDYLTPEGPSAPRTPAHKEGHNVSVAH